MQRKANFINTTIFCQFCFVLLGQQVLSFSEIESITNIGNSVRSGNTLSVILNVGNHLAIVYNITYLVKKNEFSNILRTSNQFFSYTNMLILFCFVRC